MITHDQRWSLPRGNTLVPSRWQATRPDPFRTARYLGFVRVTDTIRQPVKSAISSAIRQGLLGYEGSFVWRL